MLALHSSPVFWLREQGSTWVWHGVSFEIFTVYPSIYFFISGIHKPSRLWNDFTTFITNKYILEYLLELFLPITLTEWNQTFHCVDLSDKDPILNKGEIGGISAGVVVLIIFLLVLICCCHKHDKCGACCRRK